MYLYGGMFLALFDDLCKYEAKFTDIKIEKSSELADTAILKISIKSAQSDLDEQFIKLGKVYYEMICKDNVFDEDTAKIVQEIDSIKSRVDKLEDDLKKVKRD